MVTWRGGKARRDYKKTWGKHTMADLVIIKSRMLFSEVCTYVKTCKTVYFSYKLLITYKLYLCKALKIGSRKKKQTKPISHSLWNIGRETLCWLQHLSPYALWKVSLVSVAANTGSNEHFYPSGSAAQANSHILRIRNLFPFFLLV